MIVKAIIKRRVPKGKEKDVLPYYVELRRLASEQPGFISGEIFRNVEDPEEMVVIATWKSYEHWKEWVNNEKRKELVKKVNEILGKPTEYSVYRYA